MQAKGCVPLQTFAPGGTLELFDPDIPKDFVVKDVTAKSLAERMQAVLQGGTVRIVKFSERVTGAKQHWVAWAKDMGTQLPKFRQVSSFRKRSSALLVDVLSVAQGSVGFSPHD